MVTGSGCRDPEVTRTTIDVLALKLVGLEDEGNNQTVQTQSLSEDKNQDDADKQLGLAGVGTDTSITNNANSNASSKAGKTTAKPCGESRETRVGRVGISAISLDSRCKKYSDDQTVDSEHTSHDDWDDGLHHDIGMQDTHVGDTNTRLGGSVCRSKAREDESGGAAHKAKE